MRLTLRTLLAYMDGILDPADAEEIGKRIEASPVASDLLRRARDVMRRLRLKAPDVDERGTGLDPNTVAEYLDHMLPDDRVPDFERVCLESDMHLAEVAACHQILALVLGEPAEVEPASREHMYQLPQVLAEQAAMQAVEKVAVPIAPDEETPDVATTEPAGTARRPKPVVPDYLREQPRLRRRFWPVVVAVVVVGCLVVLGLELSGQLERWGMGLGPQVAQESQEPTEAAEAPSRGEDGTPAAGPAPLPLSPEEGPSQPVESEGGPGPAGPPAAEPGEAEPGDPSALPGSVPPMIPEVQPGEPSAVPPTEPAIPPTPPAVPPGGENPVPGSVAEGPAAMPVVAPGSAGPGAAVAGPIPPGPPAAVEPTSVLPPPVPPVPGGPAELQPAEPGETVPATPEGIGRLVSNVDVLLNLDPDAKQWSRVPAQGILTSQQDLLALPTYRPVVALANGVTIHLIGGSQIRLLPANEQGVLGVEVLFGRLLVQTVGKPEAKLVLSVAGRRGVVTLVDADATLLVSVSRPFTPGADPEAAATEPLVEFFAAAGHLRWEETPGAASPAAVAAPAQWILGGQPKALAAGEKLPEWFTSDAVGRLDRDASLAMAEAIGTDRPVVLVLQEMTTHRKKEYAWLAVRCLGYVGEFGPVVKVLNDRERKLDWADYVDELRAALARGPVTARQVREGLEATYGPPGATLARMLRSYSNEQLAAGADTELVGYLDHETLAFRVLAYLDLKEITGASLYYRPEDAPVRRQQPIRSWQQRRQAGDIRWQTPPRTGAAKPAETPPPTDPPAKVESPPEPPSIPPVP